MVPAAQIIENEELIHMTSATASEKTLPDGDEIHRLRTQEHPVTFAAIGERYGVSRQAVHKAYKKWLEGRSRNS